MAANPPDATAAAKAVVNVQCVIWGLLSSVARASTCDTRLMQEDLGATQARATHVNAQVIRRVRTRQKPARGLGQNGQVSADTVKKP
jgi:hypothetical protein